jgi:hypothetical protein
MPIANYYFTGKSRDTIRFRSIPQRGRARFSVADE